MVKDGAFGNKGHDLSHLSILAGSCTTFVKIGCRLCLYFIHFFCSHWQCTGNIVDKMKQLEFKMYLKVNQTVRSRFFKVTN